MCGGCEWPEDTWPTPGSVRDDVQRRLRALPIRAFQIDVDPISFSQKVDMEQLAADATHSECHLVLPGMERGKTCSVQINRWRRDNGGATWGLWIAKGPLMD